MKHNPWRMSQFNTTLWTLQCNMAIKNAWIQHNSNKMDVAIWHILLNYYQWNVAILHNVKVNNIINLKHGLFYYYSRNVNLIWHDIEFNHSWLWTISVWHNIEVNLLNYFSWNVTMLYDIKNNHIINLLVSECNKIVKPTFYVTMW